MLDSDSASSSDSEDLNTTGLIATRAKRSTAGNLYASLRANLDDEELQKELLAEDAEDVGDYEGSDKEGEDDEDAFESSSDEEDQGPPKEGEDEDLEGEKQLKRQERAEAKKKRGVKAAGLKLPGGLGRATKRVRLAETVKSSDGEVEAVTAPKPKKKSERSNWLPTVEDAPVRQSGRALAVANREIVTANLTASAARSKKQQDIMKAAAERERSKKLKHAELTQEQRLEKCRRVERETAKELGRFEEEEAERQRLREEALAAKRRRGVMGPVFRAWSGSCVWEGEKVKVGRVEHGSLGKEGLKQVGRPKVVEVVETEGGAKDKNGVDATGDGMPSAVSGLEQQQSGVPAPSTLDASTSWLPGIEQYAAQPTVGHDPRAPASNPANSPIVNGFTPSAPMVNPYSTAPSFQAPAVQPPQQPIIYHGWPPGAPSSYPHPQQTPPAPPPPPVREQAQRTLLILEDFPELAIAPETTSKPSKRKSLATTTTAASTASTPKLDPATDTFAPTAVQTLLLPDSYPPLTPLQTTYLHTKPTTAKASRKKGGEIDPTTSSSLPPAPPKARCALTQWEAKFRDPKTGVPYADLHAYKALQRVLSGGTAWSGVLGAWVGASMGVGGVGRPAKGVPVGFAGGREAGVTKEGS